ncbi:MAG: NAD(P)-dependent alcohol dehydrogenase [Clostridiaceae bacterium]|nr:NAD(P)-dependent alcohol dehydrogenase [Clostridiaceae bacterium]
MKAVVYSKKSASSGMRLEEVEKPSPATGQVLVKIHTVSLNAADYRSMQMGIGPKSGIFGADIAGRIETVGPEVKKFKVGDEVFGDLSGCGFGGLAEYVAAPENLLAAKAESVSYEDAAAVPMASLTALQALRDKGRIKSGHRVLIVGASGGVGLFALQLAKHFGAHVTAVCSSKRTELVSSLGADSILDYTKNELSSLPGNFDVILAINGNYSIFTYKKLLTPGGSCVIVGGALSQIFRFFLLGPFLSIGSRKIRFLAGKASTEDLEFVMRLVEEGRIRPVIDKRYSLQEAGEAFEYLKAGHAGGKVVINVIS